MTTTTTSSTETTKNDTWCEHIILTTDLLMADDQTSAVLIEVQNGQNLFLLGPGGTGKCMDPNTGVLMFDGTVKTAQEIKIGDKLMGEGSSVRTVMSICSGEDEMYQIDTIKGDKFVVNSQHILTLKCSYSNKVKREKNRFKVQWNEDGIRRSKCFSFSSYGGEDQANSKALEYLETLYSGEVIDISLQDYLQKSNTWKDQYRAFKSGVEFPVHIKELEIDPYFLGMWLGDGTRCEITSADTEIVEYITEYAATLGLKIVRHNKYGYGLVKTECKNNPLLDKLRKIGVLNNKHIPKEYLTASRENRLLMLGGLIDADGYLSCNTFEIVQKRKVLADNIVFLARSLGFASYSTQCEGVCTNSPTKHIGIYHRVLIYGEGLENIPLLLERKRVAPRKQIKDALVLGMTITPIGKGKYCGFTLDGNGRFLLDSFIVTHNSHTIREIAKFLVTNGKKVACTAATGIAAINLSVPEVSVAGCTIHSWAGVGLADHPPNKLVARVTHDERARKRWLETDVLVLDEISMVGAELLDKLDYVGRAIRRTQSKPFGGIQLIFSGDFLQLPPVKQKWAFQGVAWTELITTIIHFLLEEPKRYDDRVWFEMLLRFRKGRHTDTDIKFLRTRQAAYEVWLKNSATNKDALIIKPTVLHSNRKDVDFENDQELEKLSGPVKDFAAVDEFQPRNSHARAEHYIKQLDDAIPKYVYLKVGAQVMLRANLDLEAGLANGSRGVVVELLDTGAKVKWLNNTTTLVARHTWLQEDKDGKASRNQIPLILAWSLTIHKTQGCTLDCAICNLGPSIFCPGQGYVALSRVRSPDGLLLSEFYPPVIKADPDALEYVENIERAMHEASTIADDVDRRPEVEVRIEEVEEICCELNFIDFPSESD